MYPIMKKEPPVEPNFVPALRRAVAVIGSGRKAAAATGIPQQTISRWLAGGVTRFPFDAPAKFEQATKRKVLAKEFFG